MEDYIKYLRRREKLRRAKGAAASLSYWFAAFLMMLAGYTILSIAGLAGVEIDVATFGGFMFAFLVTCCYGAALLYVWAALGLWEVW